MKTIAKSTPAPRTGKNLLRHRAECEFVVRVTKLELRSASEENPLPPGVCARYTGICLTYHTRDDYDTIFLPGCLTKTRAEKVATGQVNSFADHEPYTATHVGFVRSAEDVGDAVVMVADLFDTEAGRAMREYLAAVIASGASTGLSIGFRPIQKEWRKADDGSGEMYLYYKEIDLREISITPVPAVVGALVTSVRREPGEDGDEDYALIARTLVHILRSIPEADARAVFADVYGNGKEGTKETADPIAAAASTDDSTAAPEATATEESRSVVMASDEDRINAFRRSFAA